MIKVVVIGQSPRSYFLAHLLDKELGDLVHLQLTWLNPSSSVVHLPFSSSLLGRTNLTLPTKKFHGLKTVHQAIKSINLKDKRIITNKKVIEYDFLILDETAVYSLEELEAVKKELSLLLATLQAGYELKKTARARIYCQGKTLEAWQLALFIRLDIMSHYPRLIGAVDILVDMPGNHVGDFLRRAGLKAATSTLLKKPGLTIKQPTPPINYRTIKGLGIGADGTPLLNQFHSPIGHPNVVIFGGPTSKRVNLLRVFRSESRQLVSRLKSLLEETKHLPFDFPTQAFLLSSGEENFVGLGDFEGRRTRALVIRELDRRLYRSLGKN